MIRWVKDWMFVCFIVILTDRLTDMAYAGQLTMEQVDELANQLERWIMSRR